jgi:hypothetical protein
MTMNLRRSFQCLCRKHIIEQRRVTDRFQVLKPDFDSEENPLRLCVR